MSVELCVYLRGLDLPSRDDWQRAIDAAGLDLRLEEFSPREHTGFLPATLNGEKCGFEYFFQPVEPDEAEEVREEIGNRDHVVLFVTHASEIEGRSAMLAAAVLTELAGGVFFDPQGGGFARNHGVFTLMEEGERAAMEARMRRAEEKWGPTTKRRCPKCGAPCPEYKKECGVCHFAIGRVQRSA
jgi:hypothetical protein